MSDKKLPALYPCPDGFTSREWEEGERPVLAPLTDEQKAQAERDARSIADWARAKGTLTRKYDQEFRPS